LSTPFQLHIPRAIYDEMISQAFSELPNECCGLLAGVIIPPLPTEVEAPPTAQVKCRYPLVNAAASAKEYLSDARSMFEAVRDMRQRRIDLLAVYHSHPTSAPMPSRTDLERNYSPDVVNLIISLKDGVPLARAWWLAEKDYIEAGWRLLD
jgi:proteasome lid subunit RPN8/RPN11